MVLKDLVAKFSKMKLRQVVLFLRKFVLTGLHIIFKAFLTFYAIIYFSKAKKTALLSGISFKKYS